MDITKFSRRDIIRLSALATLAPASSAMGAPHQGSKKKGLAIAVKDNNGWNKKITQLNCKWFYSWGAKVPMKLPKGIDFKPMIWGYWGDKQGVLKTGAAAKEAGIKELLGFNEPDRKNQANMSVEKALRVWPILMETGLRLGSPAAVHPDSDWMKEFMAGVKKRGLRVDFVTVHSYGDPNADQLVKRLERIRKMYNKPLWITEFAVGDWNAKSPEANKHKPAEVLRFMKQVIPKLNKLSFVERYAWFAVGQNSNALGTSALFNKKGELTPLGRFYRDA